MGFSQPARIGWTEPFRFPRRNIVNCYFGGHGASWSGLGGLGAAQAEEAKDGGNDSADEHPNSFIGGCTGKELREVGAEGVHGLDAKDEEDDSADGKGDRYEFVHK